MTCREIAIFGSLVITAVALSLFMTWGDEGSHVRNAAKTLLILLALVGSAIALFAWAASTSSGGT